MGEAILDREVSLTGYTLEKKDRNRQGGGVALYIRSTINYELMRNFLDDKLEWLFIKVMKLMTKPFIHDRYWVQASSLHLRNQDSF